MRAPLNIYVAGVPMEKVHLDILGPLPKTEAGNVYVLVMVDQFTKWVEAVAVPNQTAEVVARAAMDQFFSRMGCPREIITDQGSNFESQLFYELCELLHVTKKRTTPYHPSANGQVERMNRTLLQLLRCSIGDKQTDWDKRLPLLVMAMRSTLCKSTGFTPNRLMLGREVCTPLELMVGSRTPEKRLMGYVKELEEGLQQCHGAAREQMQAQQLRQKKVPR